MWQVEGNGSCKFVQRGVAGTIEECGIRGSGTGVPVVLAYAYLRKLIVVQRITNHINAIL
jgi:hypothetical protein